MNDQHESVKSPRAMKGQNIRRILQSQGKVREFHRECQATEGGGRQHLVQDLEAGGNGQRGMPDSSARWCLQVVRGTGDILYSEACPPPHQSATADGTPAADAPRLRCVAEL